MTTFSGPNGVNTFVAISLKSGISLYSKTGMKPNRMWTPSRMLAKASEITGKVYKRGDYDKAVADLATWIGENGVQHG